MIDDRDVRLRTVRRLVSTAFAHDKVAEALYEILNDAMCFGPRDLPQAGDREWIRGAIAVPLQRATDSALDALAAEVSIALEAAPADLLHRLGESRRWQELGWE